MTNIKKSDYKKLALNKKTIVNLGETEIREIKSGAGTTDNTGIWCKYTAHFSANDTI